MDGMMALGGRAKSDDAGRLYPELRMVGVISQPTGSFGTPAATVVPIRDGVAGLEVLLLRRNDRGPFGGMWVFPGGKVDPVDFEDLGAGGEEALDDSQPADAGTAEDVNVAAARRAAVREAHEEAGLVLHPDDLVVHSYWVPPVDAPRRFLTWFFLAPVTRRGSILVDQAEIHAHRWLRPDHAIAIRDQGEIVLAPPTWMTLRWLTNHGDVATAMEASRAEPPVRWATHGAPGPDGQVLATLWEGDVAYDDGDLSRAGRRRRLILDPAGWRAEIDG